MKQQTSVRPLCLAPSGVSDEHLGGSSVGTAEMFLSPSRGGGRVEMEQHGEQQSVRSSLIESSTQAAAGQFVSLGEGEGMHSIDTMQSLIRDVLSSAVGTLASAAGEFVFLSGSEGESRSEQGSQPSPSVVAWRQWRPSKSLFRCAIRGILYSSNWVKGFKKMHAGHRGSASNVPSAIAVNSGQPK